VHPVLGLPGGVSKALKAEDLPKFKELAKDGLEFAEWTLEVFKQIVLGQPGLREDDHLRRLHPQDLLHGHGGRAEQGQLLRRQDSRRGLQRQGVCKFAPQQYLDYVAEHVEPWSYMKFTYLKPRGWKGFVEGPDTSIYSVAPLARLNAADGMATPKAQAAYEEFFKTSGGKPVHHTLANHWARVIEMI
jgi:F420-non-reducing hydrogenase large subunit